MAYKSETIKCVKCGGDEFFVTTLGIEICANSRCYEPTMFLTEATGRLSYKQVEFGHELEKERQEVGRANSRTA